MHDHYLFSTSNIVSLNDHDEKKGDRQQNIFYWCDKNKLMHPDVTEPHNTINNNIILRDTREQYISIFWKSIISFGRLFKFFLISVSVSIQLS